MILQTGRMHNDGVLRTLRHIQETEGLRGFFKCAPALPHRCGSARMRANAESLHGLVSHKIPSRLLLGRVARHGDES